MRDAFVIGVDFGTDSARAVVVDSTNGDLIGEQTASFRRWSDGKYCDPATNQFRQHPLDIMESLEASVRGALRRAGSLAATRVIGIAADATGSTPCPVTRQGVPLAITQGFQENPNAMFHLWKDHTAVREAAEINDAACAWEGEDFTRFQGQYSSEWFWAKILRTTRVDASVRDAAWSWVEHCDWIPALLSGASDPSRMYRCSCAAGHKALWHSAFGGLPAREFLSTLHPYLAELAARYGAPPRPSDTLVGTLTHEWSEKLGLDTEVVVGGSSLDAHAGAVAAGIEPNVLVKVIGTSTVDLMIADSHFLEGKNLKEICGQAEDSIIPGFIGLEAGQAAFGDIFRWYSDLLMWPIRELLPLSKVIGEKKKENLTQEIAKQLLAELARRCEDPSTDDPCLIALDWLNGRRYPQLNEHVKAAISGIHLGTGAPELYKALVVGAAFGSRRIMESFVSVGLETKRIFAMGGVAQKSPLIMQVLADVLNRPILVAGSTRSCALGAAMYAAVAAGKHRRLQDAQAAMGRTTSAVFVPDRSAAERYNEQYKRFLLLGSFVEKEF